MRSLLILLLSVCPLLAQAVERTDTAVTVADTTMTKPRKNIFIKAQDLLINYLDHYSFDTSYIRPPEFYYTLMLQHSAGFESYSIRCSGDTPQKLKLSPNHSYKLGLYFGWHTLFIGLSANTDELFSRRKGSNKKTEYYINMYGYKLGCDFFYRSIGNDLKIREAEGFYVNNKEYNFSATDFSGMKVKSVGLNVYYVFNNKHFSYPAAYSQTTVQKISRGTLVAGLSWSRHNFDFDYTQLPDVLRDNLSEEMKFTNIKYTDFNINFGYAFNWVFADNWLAAVALTPALAYKSSNMKAESAIYNEHYRNINIDFITRAGLVYNNNRFFAGASAVAHVYQYYQKKFSLTNNFGVINFYVGFNFGRRKEGK